MKQKHSCDNDSDNSAVHISKKKSTKDKIRNKDSTQLSDSETNKNTDVSSKNSKASSSKTSGKAGKKALESDGNESQDLFAECDVPETTVKQRKQKRRKFSKRKQERMDTKESSEESPVFARKTYSIERDQLRKNRQKSQSKSSLISWKSSGNLPLDCEEQKSDEERCDTSEEQKMGAIRKKK